MEAIDQLLAAEGVRNCKATYWYAMDTKNYALLETVFAADAIFDAREERDFALGTKSGPLPPIEQSLRDGDMAIAKGPAACADMVRGSTEHWITVHHGAAPIITVTSADTAEAIWPLFDYIDDGKNALMAYGHYHEKYRRTDGQWQITFSRITRLRGDGKHPWAAMVTQSV